MQGSELSARLFDLDEIADKSGKTMFSGFLSPADAFAIAPLGKRLRGALSFSAGYDGAERVLAVITPQKCRDDGALPITYLKIRVRGDEEISHRDVMGAILVLGIKRDALGDIVAEGDIVVAVSDKVADYIMQNLVKIGRASVDIEPCNAPCPPAPQVEEITATVASLRLDSVVSEGFGISRGDAAEFIKKSAVAVNWQEQCSPSKEVKIGDKISLRGKGKILLYEIGGQSRKGRTFITIHRYK